MRVWHSDSITGWTIKDCARVPRVLEVIDGDGPCFEWPKWAINCVNEMIHSGARSEEAIKTIGLLLKGEN